MPRQSQTSIISGKRRMATSCEKPPSSRGGKGMELVLAHVTYLSQRPADCKGTAWGGGGGRNSICSPTEKTALLLIKGNNFRRTTGQGGGLDGLCLSPYWIKTQCELRSMHCTHVQEHETLLNESWRTNGQSRGSRPPSRGRGQEGRYSLAWINLGNT